MISVGTDIVDVKKFQTVIAQEGFLQRVFNVSELKDTRVEHLAGIFAAKEAFFKACGRRCSWKDVKILYKKRRPYFCVSSTVLSRIAACDVSIAHDGQYAIATAVILKRGDHENTARHRQGTKKKR